MRSLALTAACAALVLAPTPAAASAQDTATLAINGVGTALVAPDVATVSIEVRSSAATRQSARRKANARTRRVLAALAAKGVTRAMLTTSGVTLSRTHVKKQVRFNATNAISVRLTDVGKVGPVIDAATKAGADTIDGPYFQFSDPSAGKAAATRAALADARRRADDVCAAAGMRVTGIRSIVVDPESGPTPFAATGDAAPSSASGLGQAREKTQVDPGRQEVMATVQVVYAISPA